MTERVADSFVLLRPSFRTGRLRGPAVVICMRKTNPQAGTRRTVGPLTMAGSAEGALRLTSRRPADICILFSNDHEGSYERFERA